ncbi:ATPase, T2SS/T4P/T4SS family (plasmid) [Shewanella xiamenensis]|uniref:ATPase, T2SS/T4P/T4SS family n=1 Tax=Shewanella xiamenensis TaxID=332186 RepID=A0ABT6UFP0_9GAMM|nr:ATPase, T2SS/T4P/T4SS family [Shewanella xiamenensis]MDI5833285.1 ATPase, T2SS/T4P/T4SS family [Shewanella xiamenensis]WHF57965.1 ATPase, T2SS/T4P/T4SS family [Shewanella xiamenensis]
MARDDQHVNAETYDVKPEYFDICNDSMNTECPFIITTTNVILFNIEIRDLVFKSSEILKSIKVAHALVMRSTDTVNEVYVSKSVMFDILSRCNSVYKDDEITEESSNRAKDALAKIMREVVELNASDVHVRAIDVESCYYFRVHGVLTKKFPLNKELAKEAIGHLINVKIKNDKNLSDESRTTNGTINDYEIKIGDKTVLRELRISKTPVRGGEKLVIRVNDAHASVRQIEDFGYDDQVVEFLYRQTRRLNGLIMVTGPTGSGKTNILASMTVAVDDNRQKLSVEDPVEIRLPNVDQIQITGTGDLTFEKILKVILRQDPDMLMFGEVRTSEVANHLMQFTRTGHLVLTTIHVNSAAQAPERLMDLGIKPEEMRSTLGAVIAVRLGQVLCNNCKISVGSPNCSIDDAQRKKLIKLTPDISSLFIQNPLGCKHCNDMGITGRKSVIEYIELQDDDYSYIASRDIKAWESHLRENRGWKSMGDRAKELVLAGVFDPLTVDLFIPGVYE